MSSSTTYCRRMPLAMLGLALGVLAGPAGAQAPDPSLWPRPDAAAATAAPPVTARPRIGLVLGGGGAKGAAHVGVLAVLEELRIPVDCVVGTSMGALVGGIYAAGVDAAGIDHAIREIPWNEVLAHSSRREKQQMRRKLSGVVYSNSLSLGYKDGKVVTPRGFIDTQNIEQTIRHLSASGRSVTDFDDLAIPFRAIATDMRTGDMVVKDSGDLALALRASMAVPGVFAPVLVDGQVLGDGGLVRNLGVDVARELCADVVIAVALPNPPPSDESLTSPVGLVGRTLDVLIGANEREQLRSLGADDVAVIVHSSSIGSASFDKLMDAIPLGRAAALEAGEALARLSLPEAEYQAWREGTRRTAADEIRLAAVEVRGLQRIDPRYVESHLSLQAGDTVTLADISAALDSLYALEDFAAIEYRLVGDPASSTLEITAIENELGATTVRVDLGLYTDSDDNNAFILGGDLRQTWVNRAGGEWHAALQLGRTTGLEASFYQPLDVRHRWFVEPRLHLEQSIEDLYQDGEAAARYEFGSAVAALDAGYVFGNRAELRAGVQFGSQSAERGIAPPEFPELSGEGYGGLALRYVYDSRNRAVLATRGWLARLQYFRSEESLGAEGDYDRLEGMLEGTLPLNDDVILVRAAGGSALDSLLPVYDTFVLGGPISFPGLAIGELRGNEYWAVNASYLHKVADISTLFGQAFYLGGGVALGDMNGRLDFVREDPILSFSLLASARTPLGPVSLSLATTTLGGLQLAFTLGRPIEERAISDPAW
jgi:NTE family protein